MKTKVLFLIALLLGVLLFACAGAEKIGDYEYELNDDGTATITKYNGSEAELVIPAEIDGHKVIEIGDRAFSGCWSLTNVTIPDSVIGIGINPFEYCEKLTIIQVSPDHPSLATIDGVLFSKSDKRLVCYPFAFTAATYNIPNGISIIGDYAFYCCSRLTNVTIPDSVTKIGDSAFRYCISLTSVTIPDSVTSIEICTFAGCKSLTSVTIPDSVTSIGNHAFSSCSSLTSVTIPDSVTSIGDRAFYSCKSLTSVTIPDSVTGIGDLVFAECKCLMSVSIPDSVTSIAANPFASCQKLTKIQVSLDHPSLAIIDGVLYSKPDMRLVCYPCTLIATEYCIPDWVRVIGDNAFSGCNNLTSVTIPDSVTRIGDEAFNFCSSLTSVVIPDSVTSIGDYAFYWCDSLTNVTILDNVTSIGDGAFSDCSSLTSVTIPDSVTSIGVGAFTGCPETLTFTVGRGSYAAQYCKENGLNYTYPDSLDWLNN